MKEILTKSALYSILTLVLLSGCTMAPHYERPDAPIAGNWPDSSASPLPLSDGKNLLASDIGWRDFFKDPKLQQLIELSLKNNRNLRVALLNVQKARAQYRIQRAELMPTIAATAGGNVQRIPKDLSPTGFATTSHQYDDRRGFNTGA